MIESAKLPLLLKELRLSSMLKSWETYANEAREKSYSYEKFLADLSEQEVSSRYTKRIQGYTKQSKLPVGKTLSTFDFKHAKHINRLQVESMTDSAQWVKDAENILIFGASGVGKSHLAVAIGYSLIEKGVRILYMQASKIVQELQLARKEYRFPQMLTRLSRSPVLILDDIGYAKKDVGEISVLFDLIADRYESTSLIITANQPFSEWDQIFQDNMMAVAAIDRLVHHATIIEVEEKSYRQTHAKDNDICEKIVEVKNEIEN